MTSLWKGDIAHADIVRKGDHMCIQLNTPAVANADARKSIEHGLHGAHLEQGPCSKGFKEGVYHKGPVSVWIA